MEMEHLPQARHLAVPSTPSKKLTTACEINIILLKRNVSGTEIN